MKALLKKSCPDCTDSRISTYFHTIRSLAKLAEVNGVPLNHQWITDELLRKVKAVPKKTTSKNMAVAALKALAAYTQSAVVRKKREKWGKYVSSASEMYSKTRDKQKRTTRESRAWPKGGYAAIAKLAETLRKEVKHILQKAPATVSFTQLWKLGRWFTFLFYSKHALRGDLADLRIKKGGSNYLYKKGKAWHVHVGDHKTVKSHGAIDLKLHEEVHKALQKFMPYVRAKTDHGYLLSTKRFGNRLDRRDMMKMIRNTTEDYLGKRIGVQLIRVMKTTAHLKTLDEAAGLRAEMAHGPSMQWKYVSRVK